MSTPLCSRPEHARAKEEFSTLGGDAQALAYRLLTEACAYVVSLAPKMPDFQHAATIELLRQKKDLPDLQESLANVLKMLDATRVQASEKKSSEIAEFETEYRRLLNRKLDKMELFGVEFVGPAIREYSLSVAYITLTSTVGGNSGAVDVTLARRRRICLRGEAGSGKTTLLRWIAVRVARRELPVSLQEWSARMPFYVQLRDYVDRGLPSPDDFLERNAQMIARRAPDGWVHGQLRDGAVVLLDSIDEIPVRQRPSLITWIDELIETFPQSIFIVSSRPVALDARPQHGAPISEFLEKARFDQVTLESMSLEDSDLFVRQWHAAIRSGQLHDAEINEQLDDYERALCQTLRDRAAIRSLASNPLLCAMTCALNWNLRQRLPDNRMALYSHALNMLLFAREEARGIKAIHSEQLQPNRKQILLDHLAYWMLRNDQSEVEYDDALERIKESTSRIDKRASEAPEILLELLERCGVLRQPEFGMIDFIHRTFLEYMGARRAVELGDIGFLCEKAQNENWREVVVFAAGHAKGTMRNKLIKGLLKGGAFGLRAPSLDAKTTAVCCLETTGTDLDEKLLAEIKVIARSVFPPRDLDVSRKLAPAASLDPKLLLDHQSAGEAVVVACICCASLVGGQAMLPVIESYADMPGSLVENALLEAWSVFDPDEYLLRIIRKRSPGNWTVRFHGPWTEDTYNCLMAYALAREHPKTSGLIGAVMLYDNFGTIQIKEMRERFSPMLVRYFGKLKRLKSLEIYRDIGAGALEALSNRSQIKDLTIVSTQCLISPRPSSTSPLCRT
ncbi:NACHT domain-containing NTPase [Paraburkholderia sp. EG287A]|uniref:NACHT domain-containing protein n=1 Tax=unclassified Paraburkholderia TaxID=2615204 RepID=UPI0034D1CB64